MIRGEMMHTIRGKRALIIGATSGIGRSIALTLATQGADVYLVGRDEAALNDAARQAQAHGHQVLTKSADLAIPDNVRALVNATDEAWGGLDILVNSAGNLYWGPTELMTLEQADSVIDANIETAFLCTRYFLPLLLARSESHIVNVSSLAGLFGSYHRALYSATKFAIVGFSESLRAEYRDRGLGVSVLCPGMVSGTSLFRHIMTAPGAGLTPPPDDWERGFIPVAAVGAKAVQAILHDQAVVTQTAGETLLWRIRRFAPGLLNWGYRRMINSPGFTEPEFVRVNELS